ncbi:prepilin peptidase [Sphingobium jiangsuense]|nr:A24 family peptidase [Sphingobium jiangsuense]
MVLGGGVLGLIFGSFLAALVMRWPEGRSVLSGRSCCDHCGRTLHAADLVPVLSHLASRGRCRGCGGRIDPVHMRMELGCAAIGVGAMLAAPVPQALGWMVLGWGLLALAVLDARHYWLPDALTLPLALLGFAVAPWITGVGLKEALVGAALGYGVLLALSLGYRAARGRDGLGLGDAKLLGALGAWFGWQALPFILLASSLLALAWVLLRALSGYAIDRTTRIAFGTFLCIAAIPAGVAARGLLASG